MENFLDKGIDGQRFMHKANFSDKIGHILIGEVTGKAKAVNGPQSLDTSQPAAESFVPLAPDIDRVRLPEQNPKNNGGVDVDCHLRRRSSRSACTPESGRRGLTPFIFFRSFTDREGLVTSAEGLDGGRIRATRWR
jgi:hypothetical protein